MLRLLILVLFLLVVAVAPSAQVPSALPYAPAASPRSHRGQLPPTPEDVQHQKDVQKELEKAQFQQRYKDLRHDTDRLLALATELKQEVDAAGRETLSLAVIKKAEEIEKLAKSVKNKMKGD